MMIMIMIVLVVVVMVVLMVVLDIGWRGRGGFRFSLTHSLTNACWQSEFIWHRFGFLLDPSALVILADQIW